MTENYCQDFIRGEGEGKKNLYFKKEKNARREPQRRRLLTWQKVNVPPSLDFLHVY